MAVSFLKDFAEDLVHSFGIEWSECQTRICHGLSDSPHTQSRCRASGCRDC